MEQLKKAHSRKIIEVVKELGTHLEFGLTDPEAKLRTVRYGLNLFGKKKKNRLILQVFEQFKDPIVLIMIAAFFITLGLGNYDNALAIGVVVLLNSLLGFFQQWKASKSIEALANYLAHTAIVVRNGIKVTIPAENLTIGDLIFLESGCRIPADARLVNTTNLTIDQSILSGESLPVQKNADEIYPSDAMIHHQSNMVFAGTTVSTGRAYAIVTSIGQETAIGEMSIQIEEIDEQPSLLQLRLKKFSKWLTLGIVVLISIIFLIGVLRGFDPFSLFLVSISLIVSAIPEGLPLAITLCLSTGVHVMARHRAVVRKLSAVETLGACDVICSDKTGTITSHQMTVNFIYVGKTLYTVTGSGYDPEGRVISDANLNKFGTVCAYTHECQIKNENGKYIAIGDPTEAALVTLSKKIGDLPEIKGISFDIPFESERRWMAVTVDLDHRLNVYIKGATAEILKKSRNMLDEKGSHIPLDINSIMTKERELANDGYRVIALGYLDTNNRLTAEQIDKNKEFTFVGLAAISDPPREEVFSAIEKCKRASIQVKMITGDFPLTAKSIAEKIKLADKPLKVLTGDELEKIPIENRSSVIKDTDVFARVLPKHKVMIVNALQLEGCVVAMTGDGVNDAASLKKANIGVAMGSGSDVAKEASSLVILDDNFSTIVEAVKQGRIIYENLQKMVLYLLTTALSGVLVIMITTFLGLPLPLLPIQLLWINLVTDGSTTIPLALEKGSDAVLKRTPNSLDRPFLDRQSILRIILIGLFMSLGTIFIFYYDLFVLKTSLQKAQTMAFSTLAFFQIWNVQCCRAGEDPILLKSENSKKDKFSMMSNQLLFGLMLSAILLQLLVVQMPWFERFLNTVSLSFMDWVSIMSLSLTIFVVSDLIKFFQFRTKSMKKLEK